MNNNDTKKSLKSSVAVLFLCVVLLIGTTFAWFTDSVASGTNKIQAGNLDIEFEYATFDESNAFKSWEKVTKDTSLFADSTQWEPGHTEVVYLKISNAGSLALKYQLGINVLNNKLGKTADGKDIDLRNFLKFGLSETNGETGAFSNRAAAITAVQDTAIGFDEYAKDGKLNAEADTDYIAMVVYMPETTDNSANHNGTDIPAIDFGISLAATQDTVEYDSFDNRYDANAQYPEIEYDGYTVTTPADKFEEALNTAPEGGTIVVNGNVNLTKRLTINKNVTVKAGSAGATFTGTPLTVGSTANVTLEGLTFAEPTNDTDKASAVYASNYSGNLTVKNCTFKNCKWEGIQVTPIDGAAISVTGCTFTNEDGWKGHRFLHIESTAAALEGGCTADVLIANNNFGKKATVSESLIDVDFIDYENHLTAYGNTFEDGTAIDSDIFVCNAYPSQVMSNTYAFFTKAQ